MSDSHPLDDTFDTATDDEVMNVFGMNLEIPEDPTLRTIVTFALEQYKTLVEQSQLVEPSDRLEILELARDYLNLAKDTMHKESDLEIKFAKLEQDLEKKKNPKELPSEEKEEEEQKELTSKQAVWERLDARRRGK